MEDELFEDKNKPYKKRKLHDLLDKYGTIDELEQHGSVEDNFDYMFAGQRELLDEVLEERRESTALKAENENYDEAENLTEKRQKTAVNLQKKLLEDDEQEKQKSGAHETLPATSRSSLDDEDMAKNAAKHPMYQTASEKEVEPLRARSLADRVKENQSAENEYNGTKSDGEKVGENKEQSLSLIKAKKLGLYKDSSKFRQLLDSVFKEEGGYEDRKNRIDQPTNMGITQGSLANFNRAHPNLKIDKNIKNISREDAKLIYKLDYYDQYRIEEVDNEDNAKLLLHMFVMLRPDTSLNLLHRSLNEFGYHSRKLLSKEMIPALNKIERDGRSGDFKKILKTNFINFLEKSSEAKKYRGWVPRVKRI